MSKKILFAPIVLMCIAAVLLAGCAPQRTASYAPQAPNESASPGTGNAVSGGGGAYSSPIPEAKRIVLKNASLTIAVDDPAKSMDTISKMAENMGGFVVSASLNQTTLPSGAEVPQASVTVRVPAERLDEAMTTIRNETKQPVIDEHVDSQDVTKDYTDLQSRLTNLESAQAQLQKIMDNANRTEDVLSVYNQQVSVQEQIEVIKGQIKYYDEAAALSSIAVTLKANEAVQPLSIGGWQPVGTARDAIQALIVAVQVLANILIWVVLFFIPLSACVVLPLAIIFFAARAAIRRRKKVVVTPPPAA